MSGSGFEFQEEGGGKGWGGGKGGERNEKDANCKQCQFLSGP